LYDYDAFDFQAASGSKFDDGNLELANIVAGLTIPYTYSLSLATGISGQLWSSANGPTAFKYLRVVSDVGTFALPVILELTTDLAAATATGYATVPIIANCPFKLFGNASYASYIANFGGGTIRTIDRIRAKNLNASTANVKIWVFN
jgi:hypothetical protein